MINGRWQGPFLLWAICSLFDPFSAVASDPATDGDRVRVELFVMPHCPYGMQAEAALAPVLKNFADQIDFRLYFIAEEAGQEGVQASAERKSGTRDGPACAGEPAGGTGRFRSLHGDVEVEEGMRQAAMMALYPGRYYDYILCRNRKIDSDDWEACARAAGVAPARIAAAVSGPEGEGFYSRNIRQANLLGINASPTLRVNGEEVEAFSDANALSRRICQAEPDLSVCETVPACGSDRDCSKPGKVGVCLDPNLAGARCRFSDPVSFQVTVLNDSGCAVCETGHFIRSTLELFPGARFRTVEIGSAEGETLAARYGIDRVPAFIFDESFGGTARFERLGRATRRVLDGYLPDWRLIPVAQLLKRQPQPGRLDLFMGTDSPFAMRTAGELIIWLRMENALDRLHVHYLGGDEGPLEKEDLWHLCVQEERPEGLLNYLFCRVRGAMEGQRGSSRAACLERVGLDPDRVGRCATGAQGALLLEKSRALAADMGIRREMNPAVVVDNRIVITGGMVQRVRELFYWIHPELATLPKEEER